MLGAIGLVVMGTNYFADLDCVWEVQCHADGGLRASGTDRVAWAFGLASEHPSRNGIGAARRIGGYAGPGLVAAGILAMLTGTRTTDTDHR